MGLVEGVVGVGLEALDEPVDVGPDQPRSWPAPGSAACILAIATAAPAVYSLEALTASSIDSSSAGSIPRAVMTSITCSW